MNSGWIIPMLEHELPVREGILRAVAPDADLGTAGRFDGVYGRIYSTVIAHRTLRRAAFGAWGSAEVLYDLDQVLAEVAAWQRGLDRLPLLLDVPCGQGTAWPLLARAGFAGNVVGLDLSSSLLARAGAATDGQGVFDTARVHADALAMPLRSATMDAAISINGLHVMPDHERFLRELARVLRPGAPVWMITPVDAPTWRSHHILAAALRWGIIQHPPPTLDGLHRMVERCGFDIVEPLGGTSITGLHLERSTNRDA